MKLNKKEKVAVIMSVYRSDHLDALTEAVESILNQSYICDLYLYRDGTVPLTLQKAIDEFSRHPRVSYHYSETNLGLAFALNKLVDEVLHKEYDFIARMDSDDISRVNRIEKQVDYFNKNNNIDVCGTSCREFGASYSLAEKHLPTSHNELLNFSIVRCPFVHPTVMFRSSVFIDGNRYPVDTDLTEDMALWFELLNGGYQFGNLSEILLDYRLNEDTIKRRQGLNKAISEIRIRTINMISLRKVTLKNALLIYSRAVFHLMPSYLVKLAYKNRR